MFTDFLGRFILVVFGMGLILLAFFYFEHRYSFISDGIRTKGKIVDYTALPSGNYAFVYLYYVDHKRYIQPCLVGTVANMGRRDRRRIGQYYDIIYQKDSPTKFIEAHAYKTSGFMVLCVIMGLFLIYLAFWEMGSV